MVVATGAYVVNDAMMKVATDGLPPYEVLMLRGAFAMLWGLPLVFLLGFGDRLAAMFEPRVLARNLCETVAVLCYVVALANMPIADAIALGQITPLLVILGVAWLHRTPVGRTRMWLIGIGFAGALMVAQPTGAGISVYALLALGNAVACAARDLVGRQVPAAVPGVVVALSAALVVLAGASAAHLALEPWVTPNPRHLTLLAGAGLFLIFGHFFIFMAYRVGTAHGTAPFYYSFTVWAMIAGLIVFGELPNRLALAGIGLVVASGLAIVLLDSRLRRPAPVA